MKMKWLVVGAAALSLASLAWVAAAQERPAPEPEGIATGPGDIPAHEAFVDAEDAGEPDAMDQLLAADAGGGPGPGDAMDRGRGGPRMRRGPGARGMEGLREELNLTEDQRSRLADIHDRQARTVIPIQGDLRIAELDLRKLMRADRPDRHAIDVQIDRIAGLRAQLQKSRVASMLDARAILTPAQQKLMREQRGMGGHGRHDGMRMRMMDDPMMRPRR
jgi:Spy/CpxP family protein refolding chaperone